LLERVILMVMNTIIPPYLLVTMIGVLVIPCRQTLEKIMMAGQRLATGAHVMPPTVRSVKEQEITNK